MTRKEFIENSLLMGVGLPLLTSALMPIDNINCIHKVTTNHRFTGKVVIIGAGAAGMAAGYLLKKNAIDFIIIEAAPQYGGRIKKEEKLADFPLDLGAEWLHISPKTLEEIVGFSSSKNYSDIMEYNPKKISSWKKGKLKSHNYLKGLYSEWKFEKKTWFDFFEQHIIPEINSELVVNTPISKINYQSKRIVLTSTCNQLFEADKVLVTVPIKVLQNNQIQFTPELPVLKKNAIDSIFMGDGIKIFVAFKEKFYPDVIVFDKVLKALREEEKLVYDAAFNKNSKTPVLGLFAINEKAKAYTNLGSEEKMIKKFLAELDEVFKGQATTNYISHIIQNWSAEPYIKGAYSYSFKGKQKQIVDTIVQPLNNTIYFAGEALSVKHQATVHGAIESGYASIKKMLEDDKM